MNRKNTRLAVLTIVGTLIALVFIIVYNHINFSSNIDAKIENMGIGKLTQVTGQLEGYLSKGVNAVETTAVTLEYMLENSATKEELEKFLLYESDKYTKEIDENFTGIYGLFNGDYIDGIGWIPEEGYVPQEREWYKSAKEAEGKTVIVSPYLDAQTNTVMLSISKLLSDKESVISIDMSLDAVQSAIKSIDLQKIGYGFVVDGNGMVIAHSDSNQKGRNYFADEQMKVFMEKLVLEDKNFFEAEVQGKEYEIFSAMVMDNCRVVLLVEKEKMFHDVNSVLIRNILICSMISALILFFYIFTIQRIQHSAKREREITQRIEHNNMNVIRALVRTIDAKDRYTNGHSVRVAEYVLKIAQRMKKTQEEQRLMYYAGLLHDVGKIRVPREVINKTTRLTDEEFEQIKLHPITGYHIIKDIYDDKRIALGTKFHHERYDGKGYPNGLAGKNIPEIARIIAVADSYDAMASDRSYRKALPQEVVREELVKGKGTQFDPEIADIMLQMIEEDKEYSMRENNSEKKVILVVDDDLFNIKKTEFILKDEPLYEVISATSGQETLEILAARHVDLVLLDVEMPGMDGFETLQHIKAKYSIPVALITGDKDLETIQKATDLGVDDYITKPFFPLALREIVHSIFTY